MYKVVINTCYGGFSLSEKAIEWIKERESDFFERYPYIHDIPRHNQLLVSCIEELDYEANGLFSDLAVVEINENFYRINEYDGLESIETPSSIDFIKIDSDE